MSHVDREIVIEPGRGMLQYYWREIWTYREIFVFLAWRDLLVRYKQTVIGVSWSVIQPVMTMIIFTVVFEGLANLPSETAPYPILVFTGLLPWRLFASALSQGSNSLVSSAQMISRIYFPRLAVPTSSIVVSFVDFLISFVILLVLMIVFSFTPGWRILTVPLFTLLAILAAMGGVFWFASLNVKYRDFRFIVPFIISSGLYLSPVGFSSEIVPEQWRFIYSINPMVGVIDGFRWAIIGNAELYWPGFITSVILVLLVFVTGLHYFRQTERTFADVI